MFGSFQMDLPRATTIATSPSVTEGTTGNLFLAVGMSAVLVAVILIVTALVIFCVTIYYLSQKKKTRKNENKTNSSEIRMPTLDISMTANIAHDEDYTILPQEYSYPYHWQPTVSFMTTNRAYGGVHASEHDLATFEGAPLPIEHSTRSMSAHGLNQAEIEMKRNSSYRTSLCDDNENVIYECIAEDEDTQTGHVTQ